MNFDKEDDNARKNVLFSAIKFGYLFLAEKEIINCSINIFKECL